MNSFLFRRVPKARLHYEPHPPPNSNPNSNSNPNQNSPTPHDWFNFVTSFTNVCVISSVLWGFEQYHEKLQMIEDTNHKIDEILVAYRVLERKCTKAYALPDQKSL